MKWRCCGSMIAASRGADAEEAGVEHLEVVEHAVAAHVVRVVEHAARARRRPRSSSSSRSTRQSSPAATRRHSSSTSARRGSARPCRRWRCRCRPPRPAAIVVGHQLVPRPDRRRVGRARAGASRRGRCRSAPPTAGASPLGGAVAVEQRVEVGGERAHGREAEDVGERERRRRGVAQPAEHLDGEQRVAADVEEVVVAPDGPLELGRSRSRRRGARCRRPAAPWRPGRRR